MNRNDTRILLSRIIDRHRVPKGRVRVEKILRSRSECNPFCRGSDGSHHLAHGSPSFSRLDRSAGAGVKEMEKFNQSSRRGEQNENSLPFVEGRPGHLDCAYNSLLEMLRVLLHDDDTLLKSIFLVDLLLELSCDQTVRVPVQETQLNTSPLSRVKSILTTQGSSFA